MFARLLIVNLGPEQRETGEQLAQRWSAAAATLPGFVDVTFFADYASGECGYLSVWETERQALEAHFDLGPQLSEAMDEYAVSRPAVRIYEVFEPRE